MALDEAETAVARHGTRVAEAPARELRSGGLSLRVEGGAARGIAFGGVEVVRGIACPVRDENWATLPDRTIDERVAEERGGVRYERDFEVGDGLRGRFLLSAELGAGWATVTAEVLLQARRSVRVNRAGFVVLHPLRGVVGRPLRRRRPDGPIEDLVFPSRISPGQPVFDVAGLTHEVEGVSVEIDFEGEVFEMEDQRNWTDASFKTYCRPLTLPRPYDIAAGAVVTQRIEIRLTRRKRASDGRAVPQLRRGRLPALTVAVDEPVAPLADSAAAVLRDVAFVEAQLRLTADSADEALAAAAKLTLPLSLEVVVPTGADPAGDLRRVGDACLKAGVAPARILALPEPYLASHQPEGPWPEGPTPADAAQAARSAFPAAEVGGGMLTNFTELNRNPSRHQSDYVSFGTTAIVHAADDASVLETLEALPDVFLSALDIAGERPLRLGLVSIGMRSNPYGAAVAENPEQGRVAMAQNDPRQRGLFAAAFLVGVVAAAAEVSVASLSPGMANGPLGLVEDDGSARPLFHVVRALARLSGAEVEIEGNPGALVQLRALDGSGIVGVAANLGPEPTSVAVGTAVLLTAGSVAAARSPRWLCEAPRVTGRVRLEPLDVAFLVAGDTR